MPDIFDEVEEDLRADRARRIWQRYGIAIIGAAVLVVAGTGAYEAYKNYSGRQTGQVADAYISALEGADSPAGPRRDAAADILGQVADGSNAGYRTLARLRLAALKADTGDLPAAMTLWDQVAGDGSADPLLRGLASLQAGLHSVDKGDPALAEARLRGIDVPGNPWRPMAEEGLALLAMRQGNTDAARTTLKQLAQDVSAPEGVRGVANGLLATLGG